MFDKKKRFSWIYSLLSWTKSGSLPSWSAVIFSISNLSVIKTWLKRTTCSGRLRSADARQKSFSNVCVMSATAAVMTEIKISPHGMWFRCSWRLISQPALSPGAVCQIWHVWNGNMLASDLVIYITAACWNVPRMQRLKQLHIKETQKGRGMRE